jgi:phosphatidate cytidylyltransferase
MRRVVTGLGLVFVALYLVFLSPQFLFLCAALTMSLLCFREYRNLVQAHAISAPGVLPLAGGILFLLWPMGSLSVPSLAVLLTLIAILNFVVALRSTDMRTVLPSVACGLLGIFYTFAPWRFAVELRKTSVHLLFFALALNWAGDTAAYYGGRTFGKRKLAPNVSPNKTWEGAIASVTGSIVFGVVYLHFFLPDLKWWEVVLLSWAGNVAGQLGDLVESAIKRGAQVKDSGTLLPGHGGMLDRVDSSLFALPIVYFLYQLISIY